MNPILLTIVAIIGAQVHTNNGPPMEGATVLIKNGRIVSVGTDIQVPSSARKVDAQGLVLTPGFIDPWTQLGLVEIWGIPRTRDGDAGSAGSIRAAYRVADSYNSESHVIPIQRAHGITSAMVTPSGGSGQTSVFNLGSDDALIGSGGLVASLGAGESHARGHRFAELKTVFDDALFYSRSQKAFAQNRLRPLAAAALDLEAVIPVARGEKPLFLRVNRRSDIRAAVRWAQGKYSIGLGGRRRHGRRRNGLLKLRSQ